MDIYIINAFVGKELLGNPAAICPVESFPNDSVMQGIAAQNNLPETAFIQHLAREHYHIRWFSPKKEVKLCGHATLAASEVIFNHLSPELESITFASLGGELTVEKNGDQMTLKGQIFV